MDEKQFLKNFIEYFNENIKNENRKINEEYDLKKAKLIIILNDLGQGEMKRAYKFIIDELFRQNLSIDYITPEMIEFSKEPNMDKRKDKRHSLVLKSIESRKPLRVTKQVLDELKTLEGMKNYINILISNYNKAYQIHKTRVNTYDTFEFVISHTDLSNKNTFKNKFAEECEKLNYKIYQLKFNLLEIEEVDKEQYLVRYNYGE